MMFNIIRLYRLCLMRFRFRFIFILIFILIVSFYPGVHAQNRQIIPAVSGFALSPNDQNMIIAYNGGETGCICIVDLKSGRAKKIISGNKELCYFKPEYSPDGKKITFVGYRS